MSSDSTKYSNFKLLSVKLKKAYFRLVLWIFCEHSIFLFQWEKKTRIRSLQYFKFLRCRIPFNWIIPYKLFREIQYPFRNRRIFIFLLFCPAVVLLLLRKEDSYIAWNDSVLTNIHNIFVLLLQSSVCIIINVYIKKFNSFFILCVRVRVCVCLRMYLLCACFISHFSFCFYCFSCKITSNP